MTTATLNSCNIVSMQATQTYEHIGTHLCHLSELAKMYAEPLLTLIELSTTKIVSAVQVENAVDYDQAILACGKVLGQAAENLVLVLAILGSLVRDVVNDGLRVHLGPVQEGLTTRRRVNDRSSGCNHDQTS